MWVRTAAVTDESGRLATVRALTYSSTGTSAHTEPGAILVKVRAHPSFPPPPLRNIFAFLTPRVVTCLSLSLSVFPSLSLSVCLSGAHALPLSLSLCYKAAHAAAAVGLLSVQYAGYDATRALHHLTLTDTGTLKFTPPPGPLRAAKARLDAWLVRYVRHSHQSQACIIMDGPHGVSVAVLCVCVCGGGGGGGVQ
jgi:hypothetical protein